METNNTPITIEKNIPLPSIKGFRSQPELTQIIRSMELGDSIVVARGLRNIIHCRARSAGFRMSVRRIDENNVRAWRVE